MLFLIFLMNTVFNFLIFQLGGLAGRVMPAFHIRPEQLAMVLSVPFLTNAFLGIPAGAAADRFGAARVVVIGAALTALCGFGRMGAASFGTLFAWMFMLGLGPAFLNANAAKILGAWFEPRAMGMAMGIYIAGANAGITLALATSALFPSIRSAFLTSAAIATGTAVLWALLGKSRPKGAHGAEMQPIAKSLGVALRGKNVWIGAIAMFFFMGTFVTQNGFLANALAQGKGINPLTAGLIASVLAVAFIVGTVVGPMISARLGLMRPFLAPAAVLAAIASYLAWALPLGPLTLLFLIVAGLMLGTAIPLVMALPMLLPEIGRANAGSAGGVISTLQMAGAFLIPSYVILPLASASLNHVFLFICIGYLVFAAASSLIPELGHKAPQG